MVTSAASPAGYSAMAAAPASLVVPLARLTLADAWLAGTKAASLGDLARAGFPVPEGFVVTVAAWESFAAGHDLAQASTQARSVTAAPLPADVAAALHAALARLEDARLAVRSSAVAEDLPHASFAGQYESVLNVQGLEAVEAAVRRCWASAFDARVAAYRGAQGQAAAGGMAVLVQRLVPAEAAGVAFTANPVTGARDETVVSAVRGLGERLVAGQASPDEWIVRGNETICRRAPEGALSADQALAVADLARRVEAHFGSPQDVEWAIAAGELFLLQARPITALPEPVEWKAPLPGVWLRNFRLGEWLGEPVTPLFESWLLTRLEQRMNIGFEAMCGVPLSMPVEGQLHVVVNGWYFEGWNVPAEPAALLGILLRRVLPKALRRPQLAAMIMPPTVRFGIELCVQDWRTSVLPRYQAAVADAKARVAQAGPPELVELVEMVAAATGDYFLSLTLVAGYGHKAELPLAKFFQTELFPRIGGSHQRLLRGLFAPAGGYPHAVESLDWHRPTLGERGPRQDDREAAGRHTHLQADRRAAEAEARAALARRPRLLARFERLLKTAQRFAALREEHVSHFTLGWPVMRQAVLRLGQHLVERAVLTTSVDIFFITLDELMAAMRPGQAPAPITGLQRRRLAWQRQRRLAAPLILGELPPMMKALLADYDAALRTPSDPRAVGIRGVPASPGRASGPARVLLAPEDADRLQPGDVLVAPVTTPAWTPLLARAVAIVTDTGGVAAHASLVAREFGLPAVVGTGDATTQLRDGQVVTVDGNAGLVELG